MRGVFALVVLTILPACVLSGAPTARPVFFPSDSSRLDDDAQRIVAQAADIARQHPQMHLKIVGYTLPSDVAEDSQHLAAQRVASVHDQLVRDGVAADRIVDVAGGAVGAAGKVGVGGRRVDILFSH